MTIRYSKDFIDFVESRLGKGAIRVYARVEKLKQEARKKHIPLYAHRDEAKTRPKSAKINLRDDT